MSSIAAETKKSSRNCVKKDVNNSQEHSVEPIQNKSIALHWMSNVVCGPRTCDDDEDDDADDDVAVAFGFSKKHQHLKVNNFSVVEMIRKVIIIELIKITLK